MTVRAYIATEGPHDVAFIAELLRPWGLKRIGKLPTVDPYWDRLIPRTFPHNDDLLARVPVPTFFAGTGTAAGCTVALDSANGINNLTNRVEENLAILDERPAVAVILDADSEESPAARFAKLAQALRTLGLPVPDHVGAVSPHAPRCGVFVMPDNASPGTLETLLAECASENYAHLLQLATSYIAGLDPARLTAEDLKDFRKPAGRQKAIISAMAAILRPGKAVQVSIQDNEWLRGRALELANVMALRRFLAELLALPLPAIAPPGSAAGSPPSSALQPG